MNVLSFFKNLGHFVSRTFGIIRKIVPEDQLVQAIALAKEAATKYADNPTRRAWVIAQLISRGIPESIARLLVELAVQHLKADVIDKAAGKAVVAVSPPSALGS